MTQDLLPPHEQKISFFESSDPGDTRFPKAAEINWPFVRENLTKDALKFLKSRLPQTQRLWGVNHVLLGEMVSNKQMDTAKNLRFKVFALCENDTIPWSERSNSGQLIYESSECGWWQDFVFSLSRLDFSQPTAAFDSWESYLELAYRCQVLAALGVANKVLGLKRNPQVRLGIWPETGREMSDLIAPGNSLHMFMNFDGETAEEVLNDTYGYALYSPK